MTVGHLAPEIAVALGAVAVTLVAAFTGRARQGLTTPIALAALLASAGTSLWWEAAARPQLGMDGSWAFDGVTQAAELIIAAIAGVAVLLGLEWFRTDPRRGEYPAVVLFAAGGAMLLAGAADTMELVVGMLLVSIAGYALAAYHRGSPAALEAGMRYFLIGALTNSILLFGVVLLYGVTGTTSYAGTASELSAGADAVAVIAAVLCIVVGLAFEIGAVPAHVWVPDVAQGSPVPSAAFLTAAPKVGAVVALARVLQLVPGELVDWRPLVAALAGATMILGNLAALWQDDLRRLLGWSSVSQAGYALMAVVVVDRAELALSALVVFLAGYAAATVAAFAVVAELRGRTALDQYRRLATGHPVLSATLAVSLLSLVGVPPLGGFVGKLTLFAAAIDGGYGWLAVVAVANTVVSLFYYLRVIGAMYLDQAPATGPAPARLGWSAASGAGLATAAVIAIGLLAEPLLASLNGAPFLP